MQCLYYADFISFYSPTQLCEGGTTKSNSNELPISVPLSDLSSGKNPSEKDETPCVHRTLCPFPIFIRIFNALSIMILAG